MVNLILDAYLLVSRNNKFSHLAIKDFLGQKTNSNIKRYISLTCNLDNFILDLINNDPNIKLIIQKEKPSSLFKHMLMLSNQSKAQYITFLHDDDLINRKYLFKNYQILKKYFPDILGSRFTYIDSEGKKLSKRNPKSRNYEKKMSAFNVMTSYFNPFKQVICCPSLIYRTSQLNEYWCKYHKRIGIYEDVRISYFFSSKYFILNMRSSLFSYRINKYQTSSNRNQFPRLRMMQWLRSISNDGLLNFIIYCFFTLQYYVFYKNFRNSRNSKLNKVVQIIRSSIIKFRVG